MKYLAVNRLTGVRERHEPGHGMAQPAHCSWLDLAASVNPTAPLCWRVSVDLELIAA